MSAACTECGSPQHEATTFCAVCGAPRVLVEHAAAATTEPEAVARTRSAALAPVQGTAGAPNAAREPSVPQARRSWLHRLFGRGRRRERGVPSPYRPQPQAERQPGTGARAVATDPWAFPARADGAGLVTGVPGRQAPPVAPVPPTPVAPVPSPLVPPSPAVAPVPPPVEGPPLAPLASDQPEDGWDETRLSVPSDGSRLASAPVRPVELVLPDGSVRVVAGPTLAGRDPQAAEPGWALLPLTDPRRSVSKTHAALDVDGGGLWVTDRGSTNGTVVSEPGRPPRVVEAGARSRVPAGAALHLGELRLSVRATTLGETAPNEIGDGAAAPGVRGADA